MARIYHYAAASARVSQTTSAFATVVALTFTCRSSTPYYIFSSFLLDNASATQNANARLRHITDASTVADWAFEAQEASTPIDQVAHAGIWRWPGTATTMGQTFSLELRAANSNTVGMKSSKVFAISEDTGDKYTSTEATIAFTQATYTAMSSLAFTPASSEKYIFIVSAEMQNDATEKGIVGCVATATSFGTCGSPAKEINAWQPYFAVAMQTVGAAASAGVETAQMFARVSVDTDAMQCRRSRIAVMPVSTFTTAYYSDVKTQSTGTTIPYTAHSSATFTPAANDHLTLGSFSFGGNSATISFKARHTRTAVAFVSANIEQEVVMTRNGGFMEMDLFSAASTTIQLERAIEASSAIVNMSEGRMIVLNLATISSQVDISSPALAMTMGGFAPTIVAGKNIFPPLGTFQLTTNTVSKQSVEVRPPTIPITLSGFTPKMIVDVPVNLLSMTGVLQVPTVATIASGITTAVDILPPGGAFTIVSLDPSIAAGKNIQGVLGSIVLSGFTPNVVAGKNIQPPTGTLLFQGQVPNVVAGKNILPPNAVITMSLIAPDIAAGKNIQPPLLTMVMEGFSPTIPQNVEIFAPTGEFRMQGFAPNIAGDQVISVDQLFMVMEGFAASIPGVGITRGLSGTVNLREGVSQTRGATMSEIIDTVGIEDVDLR